jgi:hypothetical protein
VSLPGKNLRKEHLLRFGLIALGLLAIDGMVLRRRPA